jgi:cell division protein FtsQ
MQHRKTSRTSQTGAPRSRASMVLGRTVRTLYPVLKRLPRGAGIATVVAIIGGSAAYGTIRGDRLEQGLAHFRDARDAFANSAGFGIAEVTVTGAKEVSRDEILQLAGITPKRSLPFLDAEAARESLKTNPWIAEATILKLYPGHLHITVTERTDFALWQKEGQIAVIARDGTLVQSFVDARYKNLPLVVGRGADKQGGDFLALLDRYPAIRDQVRASILVAERRWNLKLNNGLDIRLPESEPDKALDALVTLDRDKKLLSRDIVSIDMRLADRVTVELSEQAAQAREEALKDRKAKKKGSDA